MPLAGASATVPGMENLRRFAVLTLAGGVLLIPAAAAQAATKTAYAGTPPTGALKGVPEFVADNAFYPKRTVIHRGDKVAFNVLGFHTVTLAPNGTHPS